MSGLPSEQRFAARVLPARGAKARLVSNVPDDCVEVSIRNVCSTGIGLVLDCSVDTTQVTAVSLFGDDPSLHRQIDIKAVYCVEGKDGPYILGAKFLRELTDDELRQIASS